MALRARFVARVAASVLRRYDGRRAIVGIGLSEVAVFVSVDAHQIRGHVTVASHRIVGTCRRAQDNVAQDLRVSQIGGGVAVLGEVKPGAGEQAIDGCLGRMTIAEAGERFKFDMANFHKIFPGWQVRYSSKIHVALQAMTAEEMVEFKKLQERIKQLEAELEKAQIKDVLTEVMIDLAEAQFKVDIRKKFGPKQ